MSFAPIVGDPDLAQWARNRISRARLSAAHMRGELRRYNDSFESKWHTRADDWSMELIVIGTRSQKAVCQEAAFAESGSVAMSW